LRATCLLRLGPTSDNPWLARSEPRQARTNQVLRLPDKVFSTLHPTHLLRVNCVPLWPSSSHIITYHRLSVLLTSFNYDSSNNARRSTMLPPRAPAPSSGTSGLPLSQDPRALRDRGTQKRMWDDIAHWLMSNSFDVHSQGLKPTTITGQSFRAVFQFLVQCADSAYVFPNTEDIRDRAKWEFEFVTALRYTGYPLLGNVKMEWLASPAAPHSWPSLLGILHWLAEEGKVCILEVVLQLL
jgi:hypothetical protein